MLYSGKEQTCTLTDCNIKVLIVFKDQSVDTVNFLSGFRLLKKNTEKNPLWYSNDKDNLIECDRITRTSVISYSLIFT